jgi:hypothetical protein
MPTEKMRERKNVTCVMVQAAALNYALKTLYYIANCSIPG